MKKILLITSIVALFASCSSKPKFELEVNIHNNGSLMDKKLVVFQNIDGQVVYTDTIKIKKNNFTLGIPYERPALLDISTVPQSNINNIMMIAEKGKIQLNIEGSKVHIGGTPLNDRLQAFHNGSDSVSLLFVALDEEYSIQGDTEPLTPELRKKRNEEYRQKRSLLLKENTDRIVAFIRENVDNPVGEYYFMTNYIMFSMERKAELISFATDKLKKEFGIPIDK